MISITRAQVPAYLVDSAFYASLSVEDNEEFSVPAENLKPTQEVQSKDQLFQLLHTLRFWGVHSFPYPDSLILYLISVPIGEREQVGQLLRDFEWSSELATWFTAFHALNDASSTDPEYTQLISGSNALASISPFLVSPNETLRAKSLAVLTTVASAADDTVASVSFTASTHIVKLGDIINESSPVAYVRDVAKLLSRVCKYLHLPDARTLMPLLTRLLSWPDDETVAFACLAIGQTAEVGGDHFAVVFNARIAPRLVELVKSDVAAVQPAALRALGGLFTGEDSHTQTILNLKVVPLLVTLLNSPNPEVVGHAVWMISNIAAGSDEKHVKVLIDAGTFPVLFQVSQSADFASHKELSWVLSSLLVEDVTTPEQHQYLLSAGIVPVVCRLLVMPESDVGPDTGLLLECVSGLLRKLRGYDDPPPAVFLNAKAQIIENGGLAAVQGFLTTDAEDVRELAERVVADFFEEN